MGSLRQLHTSLTFEVEPFVERFLARRDFSIEKREEFKGWIRVTYQHIKGTHLKIDILGKSFSLCLDFGGYPAQYGSIPYQIVTGNCNDKKQLLKSLRQILTFIPQ
jgi:hypothetical protein